MIKFFTSLLLVFFTNILYAANVVTITSNITSGITGSTPTLTWSTSPIANTCVASGGWSGVKAVSGVQLMPATNSTTTFILTCTWNSGDATLSWTAPTKNTDGSDLTDLAGYKIYRSLGSAPYTLLTTINNPAILTYFDSPLSLVTVSYNLTAFNVPLIESDKSNPVSKTIVASNIANQVVVTIVTKPNAPVVIGIN